MRVKLPDLLQLRAETFLKIIGDDALALSSSQLGEDIVIAHIFDDDLPPLRQPGFYVDIGAHHPRHKSNTFHLHLQGWRGVNVDASETAIEAFRRERPGDVNLCCAVGAVEGTATFYEFLGGLPSTCDPDLARVWRGKGWTQVGERQVPIRRLGSILAEHVGATPVDFLNIDIEGLDAAALATVDLNVVRPKVIAIEIHGADLLSAGSDRTVRDLTEAGYRLVAISVVTFIFVDERQIGQTSS